MPKLVDLKEAVENVIFSYEIRIQGIESIFDTTQQTIEDFQEPAFNIRKEREKINTLLRDTLSMNEHLRKKDFDRMMDNILPIQENREEEVRSLLKSYLDEQKEMAHIMRENLSRFKDSLVKGETKRIEEFQVLFKEILAQQEGRKKKITSRLKEFQKEQQEMMTKLETLLSKGKDLRIMDLKEMLEGFKNQHEKRMVRQEERRKEVQRMLADFKKERTEAIPKRSIKNGNI
ncbi:MAG: hypothetical protein AAB110_03330 [Candidatus Desantisbacteria bacterium]